MWLGNKIQDKDIPDSESLSPPNLRIAYVIEKFPSPTESFILNEILQLQKRGIELYILVLRKQKRYFCIPELTKLNFPVIFLPKIYFLFPFLFIFRTPLFPFFFTSNRYKFLTGSLFKDFRNYQISLFFAHKLKRKNINHVHAHFAFISVDIASVLSKLLGVKYSLTAHAQDIYTNLPKIQQVIGDASFTITCTQYNRHYLNKISDFEYADKIFTVYHGVEISKWLSSHHYHKIGCSEIRVLSIARLVEKKGLIYLLKAIRLLIEMDVQITCTIVGEGPLRRHLENQIKDNGLGTAVRLLDFLPQRQIKSFFAQSDIFILPCIIAENGDRDGLPNVIMEAMLSGVPVISTSVSAIPEIIRDGITGILVREKDEKAIADAVIKLKKCPELYYKITDNGRKEVIERFDLEENIDELIKIFKTSYNYRVYSRSL
jgi:glycosyltransferase involved in cell wall biosynthesis